MKGNGLGRFVLLSIPLLGVLHAWPQDRNPRSVPHQEQILDLENGREEVLRRLDANADGQLSRQEFPGTDRAFHRLDANGDGVLSIQEFLSFTAGFWNLLFKDMDVNRDGIITRSEWLDTEYAFRMLDRDRNGVIQRREFYSRY